MSQAETAVVEPEHLPVPAERKSTLGLILGSLAVVYGDIGTSPLYALRECFAGDHVAPLATENVLGVLSLFFWSLILVVSVKYLTVVFKADNHGEGGILALLALNQAGRDGERNPRVERIAVLLGLLGAGLLYGDGVITPAISVLSAVEGLKSLTPALHAWVVPLTLVILISLFFIQSRGTGKIGIAFGPLIALWFITIAAIGLPWIIRQPQVLWAINPWYAARFFVHNGLTGFLVLGAVVLCITGTEALYADMG
ncbi:MAG TPA: KUP/HAK/KT family potassium transporter, partial [bacterium]|nr:KUP/HAK/KT family potassium transporter [bacterium]